MQSVCGYPFYPSAAIQKLKYMADSYLWEKICKTAEGYLWTKWRETRCFAEEK